MERRVARRGPRDSVRDVLPSCLEVEEPGFELGDLVAVLLRTEGAELALDQVVLGIRMATFQHEIGRDLRPLLEIALSDHREQEASTRSLQGGVGFCEAIQL